MAGCLQDEANKKRERETRALQERLTRLETTNTKLQLEKEVLEVRTGLWPADRADRHCRGLASTSDQP